MTDVRGRTAFITGGANGIGLGIARAFARAGAKLAIADIDNEALARAEVELGALTSVQIYHLDVRDRAAFAATAEAVESTLGPVTLLFNNAGVAPGAPIEAMTYELWDFGIGINLHGVINGIQTFLPKMVLRGQGGHVVNTASGAGLAAVTGALYTTAKFGVVGLSESLFNELAPRGIGVSVLCPGPVATNIVSHTQGAAPKANLSAEEAKIIDQNMHNADEALKGGVSIDAVGEMVLKAVQEGRLYIHTDRLLEYPIKVRTQALLDALPGGAGAAPGEKMEDESQPIPASSGPINVDGRWEMTIKGPTGPLSGSMVIKANGNTFTGRFESNGERVEAADCKIAGNQISWAMRFTKPMPVATTAQMRVAGDTMSGTATLGLFGTFPMVGKRS